MTNEDRPGGPEELGPDPWIERRRPDPSQPPEPVRELWGFLGESDREGYLRIYFTRELDFYAEFHQEDVVYRERVPREEPPLAGFESSRIGVKWDATIEHTRDRKPRPVDEFDLDLRLAATFDPTRSVRGATNQTDCTCGNTCRTCFTCSPAQCGQPTSPPCDDPVGTGVRTECDTFCTSPKDTCGPITKCQTG